LPGVRLKVGGVLVLLVYAFALQITAKGIEMGVLRFYWEKRRLKPIRMIIWDSMPAVRTLGELESGSKPDAIGTTLLPAVAFLMRSGSVVV
jgi:hypothetical protein